MIYELVTDKFESELKRILDVCATGDTIIVPEHKQIQIARNHQGTDHKDKKITILSRQEELAGDRAKRLDDEVKKLRTDLQPKVVHSP